MEKKIDFCIGGMHRSGTSLVAEICKNNGVYIGRDLDPNMESKTFLNINNWLMKSNGMSWYNPSLYNQIDENISNNDLIQNYIIKRLAYSKFFRSYNQTVKKHTGVSFKDPRLTFTYKLWKRLYPQLKMVVVVRNGFDVAQSLMVRNKFITSQYLKSYQSNLYKFYPKKGGFNDSPLHNLELNMNLWAQYVARGLQLKKEYPDDVKIIRYEELSSSISLKSLSDFVQCNLTDSIVKIDERKMNDSLTSQQKSLDVYEKHKHLFETFNYV